MLTRFCLYGFLKNQRYFEPFFMLALLTHEISFLGIGTLIACRSLTLNILEIPSGAIADLWGRRRCMIGSFVAYVISFLLFAWAPTAWWLFPAMILYGTGDSFRTGTHKAMIFEWLRLQGRIDERTQVYGITRSWSKFGSALSAILSAVCVLTTSDFRSVFVFATLPYALNIINFMGYPAELDGSSDMAQRAAQSLRNMSGSLLSLVRSCWSSLPLRRLIAESMCWEGVYNAVHDYLQPALLVLVLGVFTRSSPQLTSLSATQAAHDPLAVSVIAGTYAVLAVLSGLASRYAHQLASRAGSESEAAARLWAFNSALFASLGVCDILGAHLAVVLVFLALGVLQNIWRPILISRFDRHSEPQWGATVLSIESQSQRMATLVVAPLVGFALDVVGQQQLAGRFWPIAVIGLCASLPMLITARQPSFPSARLG